MKIFQNLFGKIVTIAAAVVILYVIYQWTINDWTFKKILEYFYEFLPWFLTGLLVTYILYKSLIEIIVLEIQRKESAKVIAEDLNQINQVSGAVRAGKDSSTVGAALIVKAHIQKKERKELKKLRYDLHIYDFNKLHDWLNKHGKQFFVASDYRMKKVFEEMIRNNDAFIHDYWLKKGIKPRDHIRSWKFKHDKFVPDVAYYDGLTPGGKHYLDLLFKYTIMYMYYYFVPNFIMSNQPILESWTIVKKTGKITRLFSKKLSQDYFKLKEDTPMPFPKRGFIIETETAIFYSNVDDKNEKYIKETSGIREFYTTAGHLLQEQVFIYGITQSATRVMKALRELYPGYQHVFKMKLRATHDFTRWIVRVRVFFKKVKILRLTMYRALNKMSFARIRFKLSSWIHTKRKKDKLILPENRYTHRIFKARHKISKLQQKELQLWAKGYIMFYKGVYENISDVGKKVSFPLFGVIQESKRDTTTYQTMGFKQVNRIKDCFGRYDTHFMKTVREAKEILYDMHYMDVPNWDGFQVKFDDIKEMNYSTFLSLVTVVIKHLEEKEKEHKKQLNIWRQNIKKIPLPNFTQLDISELKALSIDYGVNLDKLDLSSNTYKADVIKELAQEYKKFNHFGKEPIL